MRIGDFALIGDVTIISDLNNRLGERTKLKIRERDGSADSLAWRSQD